MRVRTFFALGAIFLIEALSTSLLAKGLEQLPAEPFTNYVVIGAFAYQKNAVAFTATAINNHFDAKFEMNPNRNLYYVYVMVTPDHDVALSEAIRLRKETSYFDTWVYYGMLGPNAKPHIGRDINPETEQNIDKVTESGSESSVTAENTGNNAGNENAAEGAENPAAEADNPSASNEDNAEDAQAVDEEIAGKPFYFKIFRADNNNEIPGDVDLIDPDAVKKIASFEGNRNIRITNPKNNSGQITLICEVFGYRKQQRDLDYDNPEAEDITKNDENSTVIPFPLARLQKGDIAVMYNVFFYKDAGVMRPESRYEVNSLLEMLKENEAYKIKIHGHTNGNAAGKIITLTKESRDFFSLNGTKNGYGSAKKLSQVRAEVIRDFLVSNGIQESRMEIKAWGGKRPLVDKLHTQAQVNVRVEIEILED